MAEASIPVAQYLRISTKDQRYSLTNQKAGIEEYAANHGYEIISTYTDPGRSGVSIQGRDGLRRLLQDVVSGEAPFQAILVYDVSRWGRFQDTDEAAHYEFLCRSAGVPVHYCAEQFPNDGAFTSSIMKALKRTMPAEYSRELGFKVAAGQRRLAQMGFRVCGDPGFGLRRMMVTPDGERRVTLETGECKAIKSARTILVPGPKLEVDTVREIFALEASHKNTPRRIASHLNNEGNPFLPGRSWATSDVYHILKNEKYAGCNVYGMTTKRLCTPGKRVPPTEWVRNTHAFSPLVSAKLFARVQRVMHHRDKNARKSDEYLLNEMRKVLHRRGRLSEKVLKGCLDYRTCAKRFGSLIRAYKLLGYKPSPVATRSLPGQLKIRRLRTELIERLLKLYGDTLKLVHMPGQRSRQVLEFADGTRISVHICRPRERGRSTGLRWWLRAQPKERGVMALVCTTEAGIRGIRDYYLMPDFNDIMGDVKVLREGDSWLRAGIKVDRLEDLLVASSNLAKKWSRTGEQITVGDLTLLNRSPVVWWGKKRIVLPPIERGELVKAYEDANALVQRRPQSAQAHFTLAYVERYAGLQDSKRECDEALRLDPGNYFFRSCAWSFLYLNNPKRAQDYIDLDAGSEWASYMAPNLLLREGKVTEAREAIKRMPTTSRYGRDLMEAVLGERPPSELDRMAQESTGVAADWKNDPEFLYQRGAVMAFAGKNEAAVHLLRAAIKQNFCAYTALENDPLLDKLRSTPDFVELLNAARMCQEPVLTQVRH